MNPPSRYVPELQALAARELAKQARSMNQKNRYYFLRAIPEHLRCLVKAFPTNFISWMGNEQLLGYENKQQVIQFYMKHRDKRHYITEGFATDCKRGITRHHVMRRKCGNIYCENDLLQKIIATPDWVYWSLCRPCQEAQPHSYIWHKLHINIEEQRNQ
jgi:hypothetical protein